MEDELLSPEKEAILKEFTTVARPLMAERSMLFNNPETRYHPRIKEIDQELAPHRVKFWRKFRALKD